MYIWVHLLANLVMRNKRAHWATSGRMKRI